MKYGWRSEQSRTKPADRDRLFGNRSNENSNSSAPKEIAGFIELARIGKINQCRACFRSYLYRQSDCSGLIARAGSCIPRPNAVHPPDLAITIIGNKTFSTDAILAASGLHINENGGAGFSTQPATRLLDTGYFDLVSYSFATGPRVRNYCHRLSK